MPTKKATTSKPRKAAQAKPAEGTLPETPALQSETAAEQEAIQTPKHPRHRVLRVGETAPPPDPAERAFVPRPGVSGPYEMGQRIVALPSDRDALHHVKGFFPLPEGASPDSLYQIAVIRENGTVMPDGLWRISIRGEVHAWCPHPEMPGWTVVARTEVYDDALPVRRGAHPRPPGGSNIKVPDADFDMPEHVNPDALIALGVPLPPEGYYREVYHNSAEKFLRASTQSGEYFLNRTDDGWMRWPIQPGTVATPGHVWPPNAAPPPEPAPSAPEWHQRPDSELSVRLQRLKHGKLEGE